MINVFYFGSIADFLCFDAGFPSHSEEAMTLLTLSSSESPSLKGLRLDKGFPRPAVEVAGLHRDEELESQCCTANSLSLNP